MRINVNNNNLDFFKCFSSSTKLNMIELVSVKPRNISELANLLEVSSTIITRNVNELKKAGILRTDLEPGIRGQQKICSLAINEILLDFVSSQAPRVDSTILNILIGQYSDYKVEPTCGLASSKGYIGMVDDPRYFTSPERNQAGILWFQSGYITYTLPSYLFDKSKDIRSIHISLEIGSEYPGFNNDYPSDIFFALNNIPLGKWTSPGNFGDKKGFYTPEWFTCGTEYGLLKDLMVNHKGTYVDGQRISDVTLADLNLHSNENQVFKISSPKDVANPGGITLFGKNFGNHDQDIIITINH